MLSAEQRETFINAIDRRWDRLRSQITEPIQNNIFFDRVSAKTALKQWITDTSADFLTVQVKVTEFLSELEDQFDSATENAPVRIPLAPAPQEEPKPDSGYGWLWGMVGVASLVTGITALAQNRRNKKNG